MIYGFSAQEKQHQIEWCEGLSYITGQKVAQDYVDANVTFCNGKHYSKGEVIHDNLGRRWEITGIAPGVNNPIYQATLLDIDQDPRQKPESFE